MTELGCIEVRRVTLPDGTELKWFDGWVSFGAYLRNPATIGRSTQGESVPDHRAETTNIPTSG